MHDYWVAGELPQSRDFPGRRVPYFDADGTACAVGHLMIASGDAAMAREIATYENNDFVAEIDHPGVGPWLARNGLTAEEAAWIQPQYGPCGATAPESVCGADGNSYECEGVAVDCGVDVASEGMCEGHEAEDIVLASDECPDSGEPASDDGSDKGCRVGDASPAAALLFLLALVRRRRSR